MCDCGNYTITRTDQLGSSTLSCGCASREHWNSKDNPIKKKYADSDSQQESKYSKLYETWQHMKSRCYSKTCKEYLQWGGRGIKVCDEWLNDYNTFKQWSLDNGFDYNKKGHELTIDRIDVDGNYEPDNCRWVDSFTQARNKTNNTVIVFKEKLVILAELSARYGIPLTTLQTRYKKGWRDEKLVQQYKPSKQKIYKVCSIGATASELAIRFNSTPDAIKARIYKGTIQELFDKEER